MALSVPKAGFAKLLKDGARHYSGVDEAVLRNLEACIDLSETTRSAFGPNGMNKMVINHIEKLFVTNDAATILKELEIQHPAAKMIVLAAQMMEQEVGDGTNLVVLLSGALLQQAESLIRMGLMPAQICEGYEVAAKKCLELLPNIVCGEVKDLLSVDEVTKALRPAVMSKQYGYEDFIARLVAAACVGSLPKSAQNFNVDNVRVCKILGAGVLKSKVLNGMVFKRGAEGDIKKMEKAAIVVYSCPFEVTATDTKGTVLIESAAELMNYSNNEEALIEEQVKAIAAAGVNVVVVGGKFGDMYLHFLNKYKLMAVRINSKFDLRRLCRSIGATALPKIAPPTKDELGHCGHVKVDELGDTQVTTFVQDNDSSRIATIVVRGSTDNLIDDIERAVDDAINTFKALTRDGRLVPGAGATEFALAKQLETLASVSPGLEQYGIEKYAHALETVPKTLADNAGVKASEVLSKLYTAHQEGKTTMGFDIDSETPEVKDAVAAGIVDLYLTKYWAIRLATNAATTILKVDQIIMSKQAGGPTPRGPKQQDEDD